MMLTVTNREINKLTHFNAICGEIYNALGIMTINTGYLDTTSKESVAEYLKHLEHLFLLYVRCEYVLVYDIVHTEVCIDEYINNDLVIDPPLYQRALNLQFTTWITRLQSQVLDFARTQDTHTLARLNWIRSQYHLIEMLKKVLRGDAYVIGGPKPQPNEEIPS